MYCTLAPAYVYLASGGIYMSGSVPHRLQVKTDNQAVTLLYRALYQSTSNYHPTTIPEMFCSRRNKLEPP